MLRPLLIALLFSLLGCRVPDVRPDVANKYAELIEATPSFTGEGQGNLSLTVDLLPLGEDGTAESVDWELWLNTRHFASGVQVINQAVPSQGRTRLTFQTPLVFRGLPAASEPTLFTVSVRGGVRVRLRTTEARYPFERSVKQSIANAPVFEGIDED